jgi:hypothetical protein
VSGDVLATLISRLIAVGGVAVFAGVAPLFATFMLDGIADTLRRKRPRVLIPAALLTSMAGLVGLLAFWWGTVHGNSAFDTLSSDLALARLIFLFSLPLSLGAFVVRQLKYRDVNDKGPTSRITPDELRTRESIKD